MTEYSPHVFEGEVLKYWEKEGVAEAIVKPDATKPKFYLLDGPPYVNGIPHVGHVKTTVFKDVWGKLKQMQGHSVWWQPGFDCGGLPIENAVEKKLGINGKNDIVDKVGAEKFIEECKSLAKGNEAIWMGLYKKIAAWRGWVEPYLTSDNYYKESGWWTIKNAFEKGLLVEGKRPGYWCPSCETVLSGYEVTDSYKVMEDPSIYIKFPVKGQDKTFLLVWTTTPWTLPANVAVAAHPEEDYVKVETSAGDRLILAEKRLQVLADLEIGFSVMETFKGKALEGMKYEPVVDVHMQAELAGQENAHRVIVSVPVMKLRVASKTKLKRAGSGGDEFGHMVDMETGTGLVHTAPGHGDVDNRIGKHYNLPEPSPVDEKGRLTADAGRFAGMFVKKADPEIIRHMEGRGLMLHAGKVSHSCPLCWRCKSPLIYRMSRQWFMKMDSIRGLMRKEGKKVKWLPGFAGERMAALLEDSPDWAVTRQRFWGIPLPVWKCGKCDSVAVVGSLAELREKSSSNLPESIEIDKVSMDKVRLKCACGGEMSRDPDIMDVWFDSSIAPWASLGYPHRNKELFERLWPADLIDESQDQIRGWFYYLLFSSVANFSRASYKTCCLNGWTLDEKGDKMSKSLGNVILAEDACKELGADVLRLYACADTAPWDTQKFSMRGAKELGRCLNIFWNAYVFLKSYGGGILGTGLMEEDRWITSRLNSLIASVTKHMEGFEFHLASREIVEFILNDLSRTYIKLIRDRVSPWYEGADKAAAQATLNHVMERLSLLMAPFTPFIAEKVHVEMTGSSAHLSSWPKPEKRRIDAGLEERMKKSLETLEKLHAARQGRGIKLRWPIEFAEVPDLKAVIPEAIAKLGNFREVRQGRLRIGAADMELALLRELSRKIQSLRKDEGMNFGEAIELELGTDKRTGETIMKMEKGLLAGVGARSLKLSEPAEKLGSLEFEGSRISIGFRKV